MEVKTIAGFINYKICKLYFQNNQPLSAIKQFKLFLEYFKLKHGPQQLIFEHYAWLSKQFSIFAELFEEAVNIGLSAIQLQHPGFYYQQAAYLTMQRRESATMVCGNLYSSQQQPPLDLSDVQLEFWGQRPWRPGIQSIDPPDLQKEKAGIEMLQQAELSVKYSPIITPLLFSAVIYFKVNHLNSNHSSQFEKSLLVDIKVTYFLASYVVLIFSSFCRVKVSFDLVRVFSDVLEVQLCANVIVKTFQKDCSLVLFCDCLFCQCILGLVALLVGGGLY